MLLCEGPELQSLPHADSSTAGSRKETLELCVAYLREQQAGAPLHNAADNSQGTRNCETLPSPSPQGAHRRLRPACRRNRNEKGRPGKQTGRANIRKSCNLWQIYTE